MIDLNIRRSTLNVQIKLFHFFEDPKSFVELLT